MDKPKKLILWINGDTPDHTYIFEYFFDEDATLPKLKDCIAMFLRKESIKVHPDSMVLYTNKEIKLDESDFPYLVDMEILFILRINESFNQSNHFYQYKFARWIKSGGYGQVYLANHIITNQEYAIKQIDTDSFSSEELYNISREHVILQSFNHKNIIKCHHSFAYGNKFYTVMDCAKGGELKDYIQDKKGIKEFEAKKIFRQIYNAVNYIHGKNIIHRDLKPNNIMFLDKERSHVVLIDFGISGFSNGNINEKIKAGTICFAPPEIVNKSSLDSSPKIDLWALGVILYYMIFRSFPFNGKNDKEIGEAILSRPVIFPYRQKISEECKDLISDLLEKNTKFRIDMNSEMFFNWFNKREENSKQRNYSSSIPTQRQKISNPRRYNIKPINNDIREHIQNFLIMNEENNKNEIKFKINKKLNIISPIKRRKNLQFPQIHFNNNRNTNSQSSIFDDNSIISNRFEVSSTKNPIRKVNSFISPKRSSSRQLVGKAFSLKPCLIRPESVLEKKCNNIKLKKNISFKID